MLLEEEFRGVDEGLLDVIADFGGSLGEASKTLFTGKLLPIFIAYLSDMLAVLFVGDEENQRVWLRLVFDVAKPMLKVQICIH